MEISQPIHSPRLRTVANFVYQFSDGVCCTGLYFCFSFKCQFFMFESYEITVAHREHNNTHNRHKNKEDDNGKQWKDMRTSIKVRHITICKLFVCAYISF